MKLNNEIKEQEESSTIKPQTKNQKSRKAKQKESEDHKSYDKKETVKQISMSGILVGMAILMGKFAHFNAWGGGVYLLSVIVFLFPLFLRLPYAILAATLSGFCTDAWTGWIQNSWITVIAYGGAVLIIWLFKTWKFPLSFCVGVVFASTYLVVVYLLLEWVAIDKAYAVGSVIANVIQMSVCIPIIWILYFPMKTVAKTIKI